MRMSIKVILEKKKTGVNMGDLEKYLKEPKIENEQIRGILATGKITKERFQDNSVFRILKNWEEGPTKQT